MANALPWTSPCAWFRPRRRRGLVGLIYLGGATLVMVLGLLLLAVGAIMLATAIARSRLLPTWAGITFAVGLALWCPLLPPAVRIVDGLLIGVGGIGLAWGLRRSSIWGWSIVVAFCGFDIGDCGPPQPWRTRGSTLMTLSVALFPKTASALEVASVLAEGLVQASSLA